MIGKSQWHKECPYKCCRGMISKSTIKAQETIEVRQEADEALAERTLDFDQDCPHQLSVVDVIAGRNACYECYVLGGGEPDPGDEEMF